MENFLHNHRNEWGGWGVFHNIEDASTSSGHLSKAGESSDVLAAGCMNRHDTIKTEVLCNQFYIY